MYEFNVFVKILSLYVENSTQTPAHDDAAYLYKKFREVEENDAWHWFFHATITRQKSQSLPRP